MLLAIPAFVFAGNLMERCGLSHALGEVARALSGWAKGGRGRWGIVGAWCLPDPWG